MNTLRSLRLSLMILLLSSGLQAGDYKNFNVAVYCRAYEVAMMADMQWLDSVWNDISRQLHVDKVYLETHRDLLIVDEQTLKGAIDYFRKKGLEVGGGITYTVDEMNNFETFCYSNPQHRQKVREIAEYTARYFNEIILDDFFFTSCKCDLCIDAKKDRSWTDFRLDLMKDAAVDLVIGPAREVNPDVEMVIKYPNWYEHFQGLGFNLEAQPALFDGLYTGTETRNRDGNQHLQQYHGYTVFRYFENLKPGENRGGWVDTGGSNPLDRYAEQLWLTLFAKSPEITLFDIRQIIRPIDERSRGPWQGSGTSFDFEKLKQPVPLEDGSSYVPGQMAGAAGHALEEVDRVLGFLGDPVGIKSYKPFHSLGEDYLQSYLGMIGIPVEIVPEFPEGEKMVLLTQSASHDPEIVSRIRNQLQGGNEVCMTSGLYRALQGKGIEDLVELEVTERKASVKQFRVGWGMPQDADHEMIIPQVTYLTNDSWEVVSALDDSNGWPLLHRADYSEGQLFVLTVPDNFIDLYHMADVALNRIRLDVAGSMEAILEGPAEVSIFLYDNASFVLESFRDEEVGVRVLMDPDIGELTDVMTGEKIKAKQRIAPEFMGRKFGRDFSVFELEVKAHSFRAFRH